MTTGQTLFTRRRIGVCGSSASLPAEGVRFCEAVGTRLAGERFAVIVSGGTKRRLTSPRDDLAADWHIVSSAMRALEADAAGMQSARILDDRIETILSPAETTESFRIGLVRHPRGRTTAARRFSFVRGVDALIAVGGGGGTAQEIALAHELEKPVLPVPYFPGAAKEFWEAYRADLIRWLRIDESRAGEWEDREAYASGTESIALANDMVDALLGSLPRRCFVVMPFGEDFAALYDFVICQALKEAGDLAIRLDRAAIPGDVVRQIDEGLAACEYAIVVLDGMRPNVLYELGIAHGRGKPTILLGRKGRLATESTMPFDLSTQQRIEYDTLDGVLLERLKGAIDALGVRRL
jgi:predicted Rossmann-fold nucleotide-binding protein